MRIRQTALQGLLGISALLLAGASSAAITTYTDRATFLAALQSGYFADGFDDISNGGVTSATLTRSGNGYSVTYSAPPGSLFSTTGGLSTNSTADVLTATVTSSPTAVFAFGADFYLTDIFGDFQPFAGNSVAATASNGIDADSTLTVAVNSQTNFFGWISTTPLTTVSMDSGGITPDRWNTIDNVVVGQAAAAAAPEPTTLALLGLGAGAVMFVRRRKSA